MGQSFESLSQLPRPFGPFTLIRLIAQGGMGQVFLALRPVEGEPTDEICVVKTVRTDLKDDREAVGRFLDEARVVQKLDHAAICHTLDAGVVEKTYYLALEFISGRNLRDVQTRAQKQDRPLPDALVFHCLMEVLDALHYAHHLVDPETGEHLEIVHRDVSPHNLMLGFDGYVHLIDFGLAAHQLKRELTRPGIMVGKLRYNAPEQVRDRALDGRSDLYSVGVMLYELITGERFYEGLSEEDIWRVAMKGTFRPRLWSAVPADLRTILDLALQANPEDRFATAADMRDAIADAARARNIRDARRAAARFMGEIFADERQAERDMILQATGLAEARTRLFAAPDMSDSAPHSMHGGSSERSEVSSVGRTKIVSPAQVRGRLADLVSAFDPNAETVLPNRPIFEDGQDDGTSDPFAPSKPKGGLDGKSGKAAKAVPRSTRSGHEPRQESKQESKQEPRATASKPAMNAFDSIEDTLVGSDGNASAREAPIAQDSGPRRRVDTNLRPATSALQNTQPGLPRNTRSTSGAAQPLPPLPPAPKRTTRSGQTSPTGVQPRDAIPDRKRSEGASPGLIVGGILALFVVAALVAVIVVPPLLADKPVDPPVKPPEDLVEVVRDPPPNDPPKVPDREPDPPTDVVAVADAGVAADDPARDLVDAGSSRVISTVVKTDKPPVDKPPVDKPPVDKRPPVDKTPPVDSGPPPPGELKTLREQVDYLKKHCVQRVACARSTTENAANIATLSPQETKELIAEIPRCIARCQR